MTKTKRLILMNQLMLIGFARDWYAYAAAQYSGKVADDLGKRSECFAKRFDELTAMLERKRANDADQR